MSAQPPPAAGRLEPPPIARRALQLGAVAGSIYLLVAGGFRGRFERSPHDHHLLIADAFLHGQTHVRPEEIERRRERMEKRVRGALAEVERSTGRPLPDAEGPGVADVVRRATDMDWTIVNGRYYGYWAPLLPAVMAPAVALFGAGLSDRLLTALIGALNVGLFYWMLRRVDHAGLLSIDKSCALGLGALFAFGTVHFYMSCAGTVWLATQQIALTALLGAIIAACAPGNPIAGWLAAGALFGLALLARGILLFTILFFLALLMIRAQVHVSRMRRPALARVLAFGAPLALAVALQAAYNTARFGDSRDFGYRTAVEHSHSSELRERFARYGTFNVRCLPRNVWHYFLNWRLKTQSDGRIWFDEDGNSMFLVTPPLIYALVAWRTRARFGWALAAAVVPMMAALLLFFFTGSRQFGNRFLLELLPFLFLLAAMGMRGRVTRASYVLIVLAVAANLFGVYRACDELCRPIERWVSYATLPIFVATALALPVVVAAYRRRRSTVDA